MSDSKKHPPHDSQQASDDQQQPPGMTAWSSNDEKIVHGNAEPSSLLQ
jgi:hypothetical protein